MTARPAPTADPDLEPERDDQLHPRRYAHDTVIEEERVELDRDGRVTGRVRGSRVTTQTPLDRYLQQRHITADQWWGGDRLRGDFERSQFEQLAQARWDGMPPAGGARDPASVSVAALEARRSYIAAIRALPQRLSPVVVHVCCLRLYAADWAIAKRIHQRDGMALLRVGLDLLTDHYRTRARTAANQRARIEPAARTRDAEKTS